MWLATDKDGIEFIFGYKPKRYDMVWYGSDCIKVPKGTIERLLNYPLTWDDESEEIVEYKNNSTLNNDDIARILKASENQPVEYLRQKIVNLHDQLNKYRKTVQNQKEELTRLLLQKEKMQQMLMMPCKSVDNDNLVKELKEKNAIIKYLENKLEI